MSAEGPCGLKPTSAPLAKLRILGPVAWSGVMPMPSACGVGALTAGLA